ncbi:PREDICTED: uncharacterized protein LOC104823590 isoform X2 [Tarenaya hassleriana]|uniref:uncharacterized protein LOC104823590 isoform X2 n=1 Tax=Tarenaya hassleriana TaxID=28532 RepID=UPI00053CA678|nr:PREDICTED: uncharacterized protein LOC104823590 isoform X2 [Tarenaya hassleriana]
MMEPMLSSSRVFSAFREETLGEEELSVLPRHTKVIVTGNNRTKSVLVGLQGVVKKAVGLGGWHWLVLKNGIEVKLQRNALSVLEHPTGNKLDDDDDDDIDMFSSGSDHGEKEHRDFRFEFHRLGRPRIRQPKPWLSSSVSRSSRSSYRDVHSILHPNPCRVNFGKLGTSALRRYCRHFNLVSLPSSLLTHLFSSSFFRQDIDPGINPDSSRDQMLNAVHHHFTSQPRMNEEQVISDFIVAAKRMRQIISD